MIKNNNIKDNSFYQRDKNCTKVIVLYKSYSIVQNYWANIWNISNKYINSLHKLHRI